MYKHISSMIKARERGSHALDTFVIKDDEHLLGRKQER